MASSIFGGMKKFILPILLIAGVTIVSCGPNDQTSTDNPPTPTTPAITYSIASTYPHDTSYFTEGLEFYKGSLLESIGMYNKSKLLQYDLATGKVSKSVPLDSVYFGEGITLFRDTIYQLTYQEGKVFMYSASDFKKIKELPYTEGEGWGLTHDSTHLIATNGGNSLFYYEPGTFKLVKKVSVNENGVPAVNLNELEYVNGYIYANQWQLAYILKIDPTTGNVVGKMDFATLIKQVTAKNPNQAYLNGIAYNPETKKFYVTGKYWPEIYEVKFDF